MLRNPGTLVVVLGKASYRYRKVWRSNWVCGNTNMEHIEVYRYLNVNVQKAIGNLSITLSKEKRYLTVFDIQIGINL